MSAIFLSPGPTKVHDELSKWLETANKENVFSKSHRSKWFEEMYQKVSNDLKTLLGIPKTHTVAFVSSATEVWERFIQNNVEKSSFHVVNGEFSNRWFEASKKLGRDPSSAEVTIDFAEGFDSITVPKEAEAICLTQSETSVGMWMPKDEIVSIAKKYPDKLIAIDVVSGVPAAEIPFELVDCSYFSIQKGFALPAGLGVVILSPRSIERARQLKGKISTIGTYHSFVSLADHAEKFQTPETPNVLGIYLLGKALEKYLQIGIDKIRSDTFTRAKRLISELESKTAYRAMIKEEKYRSPTVVSIVGASDAESTRKMLIDNHGIYVGSCYSEFKAIGLRIANFPVHTEEEHAKVIDALV